VANARARATPHRLWAGESERWIRVPTHPNVICAAGQTEDDASANAFYVGTGAIAEVQTWTAAEQVYCADSSTSTPQCSGPLGNWVALALAAEETSQLWNDAGGAAGPGVLLGAGNGNACVPDVAVSDSMNSAAFCATEGGGAGSETTTYAPTELDLYANGALTETVLAQDVGACNASLQLRAQLYRFNPPEDATPTDLGSAAQYAPNLFFDSGEKSRPLNVDLFLKERYPPQQIFFPLPGGGTGSVSENVNPGHEVCGATAPIDCVLANGTSSLDGPFTSSDYLDIHGSGDASNYYAPFCANGGLQDCDTGPASAVYYHTATSPESLDTFYDYWFFYRFNDFYNTFGIGDHEGDWEGVTVGLDPLDSSTFAFVTFSQHGTWYSYARSVLSCDGKRQSGSCLMADGAGTGQRVDVFPSQGGHTNYPDACTPSLLPCFQDHATLPEKSHDGQALWGNNNAMLAGALQASPPLGHLRWVDFPGHWGNSADPNGPLNDNPPISPGCQQPHSSDPFQGSAANACPAASGEPYNGPVFDSRRTSTDDQSSPDLTIADCPDWFGGDVVLLVCDSGALKTAMTQGGFGDVANATVNLPDAVVGGGKGITQALGDPLTIGETTAVRLAHGTATAIYVRWVDGAGTVSTAIEQITNGGGVLITIGSNGRFSRTCPEPPTSLDDGAMPAHARLRVSSGRHAVVAIGVAS
jgi:hypothetical protein